MKKTIALVMAALLLMATASAEMELVQDFIVESGTGYVWLGDVDCRAMTIRIDYPEYGAVEPQNIRLELNDQPVVMLWHAKNTQCATFSVEYLDGEIYATGTCGVSPMIMPEYAAGVRDTNYDGVMWGAIAGNTIPQGSRVRVWSDRQEAE